MRPTFLVLYAFSQKVHRTAVNSTWRASPWVARRVRSSGAIYVPFVVGICLRLLANQLMGF